MSVTELIPEQVYATAEELYPYTSALGGVAARNYLIDQYAQRVSGVSEETEDPRMYAETAHLGYIPPTYFTNLDIRNSVNEYYDSIFLPESLYDNLGLAVETSHFCDVIERLYAKDQTGGFSVPADLFLQSLAKINIAHHQEQKLFADKWVPKFVAYAREKLETAVKGKQLPDYMLQRFDEHVGDVRFVFDDGFHSLTEQVAGEFYRDDRLVMMSFFSTEEDFSETGVHELFHGIEPEANEEPGLYRELFDYPALARLLHEAVTEHATLVATRGGSVRKINPELLSRRGSYEFEREVFDELCSFGVDRLRVREFIDAQYAESDEEKLTTKPLTERFRQAFPDHNVLDDLNNILQKDEGIFVGNGVMQETRQYLESLRKHYSPVRRVGNVLLQLAASFMPERLGAPEVARPASETVVS